MLVLMRKKRVPAVEDREILQCKELGLSKDLIICCIEMIQPLRERIAFDLAS